MRPLRPQLQDEIPPEEVHATLTRILGAIEEYVYTGEFLPDGAYRLLFAGPCREQFLGLDSEAAKTAIWANYVHPDDAEVFERAHHAGMETGRLDVEYRMVGADGVLRWVRDRGRIREEGGRRFLDGSILDVTAVRSVQQELEAARAEAARLATVDPLTGVLNRRLLSERLSDLAGRPLGALLVDIDHFKQVNDLHGHAAGDAVLVELAARLRAETKAGDVVVRMGGEEFLVLMPGVPDPATLLARGEAIRTAAARDVLFEGKTVPLRVSVGAACADVADEPEALLAAADAALYAAKRAGRDRVALAGDEPQAEATPVAAGTLRLAAALAAAAGCCEGLEGDHLDEVSALAAQVAERLGADAPTVRRCRLAGLVHDVGKLRLPLAILAKPGPLTDAEWEVMRTHPALGADVVAAVPELGALAPAVRHHHERWDGSGYPDGLAGAAIPVEARVLAAADAWSAMTSDRPYRAARSRSAAEAELVAAAGSQLDPEVVDALLAVLRDDVPSIEPSVA